MLCLLGIAFKPVAEVVFLLAIGCSIALCVVYYLLPATQLTIIRWWQRLSFPLAWVLSHVLLLSVYFGIVLPIGLGLRLVGYDPLRLRSMRRESEWIERTPNRSVARYFRQF